MQQRKLPDVCYVNAAQLAYLNWDQVTPGKNISDVLWDDWIMNTKDMNSMSRQFFMAYSEDESYEAPLWDPYLKDWCYLYSADDIRIYRDLFGIEVNPNDTNGFYAVAFQKGNDIIVAFRGTNDLADMIADIELALFDRYHSQLTCVYWFLRHLKKRLGYQKVNIHCTGHSLGGALAQFAHIINGTDTPSKTWNALGIGVYLFIHQNEKDSVIQDTVNRLCHMIQIPYDYHDIQCIVDLWKKYEDIEELPDIYQDVLQILLSRSGRHRPKIQCAIQKNLGVFQVQFGFRDQSQEIHELGWNQQKYNTIKKVTADICGMMKTMKLYYKHCQQFEKIDDLSITNFVFPDDWTTNLQTKLGTVVDVTKPFLEFMPQEVKSYCDKIDDNCSRILLHTIKNYGFERHSCTNFVLFFDDFGNIQPGVCRKVFLENVLRNGFSYLLKKNLFRFTNLKKINDHHYQLDRKHKDLVMNIPNDVINYVLKSNKSKYIHCKLYERYLSYYNVTEFDTTIIIGRYNNIIFDKSIGFQDKIIITLTTT